MKSYELAVLVAVAGTAYYLGGLAPKAACLAEKNKALEQVALAENKAYQLEQDVVAREGAAQNRFATEKERSRANEARAMASAATGGLFVNATCSSGSDPVPHTPADPARDNGSSRARLSEPDGRFFIGFAAEAHEMTIQLDRCQAYAVDCHKACSVDWGNK